MDTAALTRRELPEEARVREREPEPPVAPEIQRVLELQRAAGNTSVASALGHAGAPRERQEPRAVSPADTAVARSLARVAATRSGVRKPDGSVGPAVRETESPDELDEELDEDETEDEVEVASTPATVATVARATLARDKTKKGRPNKKKSPQARKTPFIRSETKLKAPDGTDKTRTTVAVGEEVSFKGNMAGTWDADAGTPASSGSAKKFSWTAPDRAKTVTIKLTVGSDVATKTMTVIEPKTVTGTKLSDLTFPGGTQGAGMTLRFTYGPMNVSFGNVEVKEVSGPASNITGYYLALPAAELWHDSGDTFYPVGADNKDTAVDTASFSGEMQPWTDGTYDWLIPNHFQTKTEAGDGKKFATVTQGHTLEGPPNAGRSNVSKAGVSTVPRSP